MDDREFLEWIVARLIKAGAPSNVDFVERLRAVAAKIPKGEKTRLPDDRQITGSDVMAR